MNCSDEYKADSGIQSFAVQKYISKKVYLMVWTGGVDLNSDRLDYGFRKDSGILRSPTEYLDGLY